MGDALIEVGGTLLLVFVLLVAPLLGWSEWDKERKRYCDVCGGRCQVVRHRAP